MKLGIWAEQQGISYKSAWRMWKLGQLPMPAEQLPTGTIIMHPAVAVVEGGVALYAGVSSADQKNDLDRQIARLSEFAALKGLRVIDPEEMKNDIVRDLHEVIVSLCAWLYGKCGKEQGCACC